MILQEENNYNIESWCRGMEKQISKLKRVGSTKSGSWEMKK